MFFNRYGVCKQYEVELHNWVITQRRGCQCDPTTKIHIVASELLPIEIQVIEISEIVGELYVNIGVSCAETGGTIHGTFIRVHNAINSPGTTVIIHDSGSLTIGTLNNQLKLDKLTAFVVWRIEVTVVRVKILRIIKYFEFSGIRLVTGKCRFRGSGRRQNICGVQVEESTDRNYHSDVECILGER